MVRRRAFDILLAGIGIGGERNTSLATLEVLKKARVTFSLSTHASFIRRTCKKVIDLRESYFTAEEDERVYRRIADQILDEAQRRPGVALVDDGHPLFFDDVCDSILRRAPRRGLNVLSLPAISCLDAMISQCGLRFRCEGMQIVEASSLVLCNQQLNPQMDAIVMQVGWFGTSLLTEIESHKRERFEPLQRHLLKFYPKDHFVRLMRASSGSNEQPIRIGLQLSRLAARFRSIETDCSLYIPAVEAEVFYDHRMLRLLSDKDYLSQIAKSPRSHSV